MRQELGVSPPGDVRNCLVALAGRERLAEVFNYRFGAGDLANHTVGNIVIAALSDMAGSFAEGVEQAAHFLRAEGRVYPAAVTSLTLQVRYADGTVARGESAIHKQRKLIREVGVEPADAPAPPAVIEAIHFADLIVLSPGSLYTSTIPSLLGRGVKEALEAVEVPVIYVANLMTQPGETTGFTVADHLQAIYEHVGPVVTDLLVQAEPLPDSVVERYTAQGASQVAVDLKTVKELGVRVHEADLATYDPETGLKVRHDPEKLAEEVYKIALVHS